MAQTIVIGRITADLEMKTSANGNPYVRFDLVENIGSKENSRPQYFQICAWSDDAKRIVKARAKKGSLIGAPSVRKVPQGLLYLKLNNSFVETV